MTDFPMDIVIFNKISEVFNQTRSYILLLFPLAFFIRIAFGFILLKGSDFTDILKDSLFLFLGLFFFVDILRLTLQIPYFVASDLSFGEWRHINLGEGFFTKALQRIVEWIGVLSYWISFGLYVVIISILGFLAGYILFFGTMFRAYGMLKVFFILLLTASLWPLLWHSINFAVFTIAVSDNAFANNVIVGGASLAKVILPLWIISKSSKIPVAQGLKKLSFTGGGLAGAGALGGYALLRGRAGNVFQDRESEESEEEAQAAVTHIRQMDEIQGPAPLDFPHSAMEGLGEGGYEGDYGEPEDFSLTMGNTEKKEFQTIPLQSEKDCSQNTEEETKEINPSGDRSLIQEDSVQTAASQKQTVQETNIESQTVRESHTQSETRHQGAGHLQNNTQVVHEAKGSVSEAKQSLNQVSSQSMTLNEAGSENLSQNESILSGERSAVTSRPKKKEEIPFNESVQGMDFVEEEREGSLSRPLEDEERESEL